MPLRELWGLANLVTPARGPSIAFGEARYLRSNGIQLLVDAPESTNDVLHLRLSLRERRGKVVDLVRVVLPDAVIHLLHHTLRLVQRCLDVHLIGLVRVKLHDLSFEGLEEGE